MCFLVLSFRKISHNSFCLGRDNAFLRCVLCYCTVITVMFHNYYTVMHDLKGWNMRRSVAKSQREVTELSGNFIVPGEGHTDLNYHSCFHFHCNIVLLSFYSLNSVLASWCWCFLNVVLHAVCLLWLISFISVTCRYQLTWQSTLTWQFWHESF